MSMGGGMIAGGPVLLLLILCVVILGALLLLAGIAAICVAIVLLIKRKKNAVKTEENRTFTTKIDELRHLFRLTIALRCCKIFIRFSECRRGEKVCKQRNL